MIPKIIHLIWWQGYMNIPNKFIKNIDSWKHHNPNYKIIIWDNKSITKFIKKIYPKNYIILNRYFKMIQKIDFSKYLILYYYGGCYVDIQGEVIQYLLFFHPLLRQMNLIKRTMVVTINKTSGFGRIGIIPFLDLYMTSFSLVFRVGDALS